MEKELKVSLFANLQSLKSKEVDMKEIVRMLRYDYILKQKTASYRDMARVISRKEANKNIKEKRIEAFSVGVLFNGAGKQSENVAGFTGLAMCDLDHVEDALAEVKRLIMADPHTLVCYETVSGQGFRIIYRYERSTVNAQPPTPDGQSPAVNGVSWRAAFLCGNEYFKELTGCAYDTDCSDYGRLSGMAHDADVYYNPDAEPFVITDDMILKANFADGTEAGKKRRVYETGSQSVSANEAWPKVKLMLARRGMVYAPSHRHDFALHACYLFNRFGVADEGLLTWAASEWADLDSRERESIISHCYSKGADEHGTWRIVKENPGKTERHENSMITIAEIRQWLTDHVELIYNVVTDLTMMRSTEQSTPDGQWETVDDRTLATLRSRIAIDTGKRVLKNDVYDVIKSDFAPLVHPVRDYINALPRWDGKDRVAELISHIRAEALLPEQTDEQAQAELLWAFHKWHCAAVGGWIDNRVTNHQVLTLIGRQGIYKTTFFRYLLPPELRAYFWENAHNTFSSKDDHLALAENCLADIEEVEAIGLRELSELKSLITTDVIKERRPYARFREAKRRLASLCATGNQQRFLTDDTGNRRWLCFKVKHIDDPRTWDIDYQQLYAQLRDEFRSGFRYWFDYEDEKRVERLNQPFRVESDEEQLICMRLRKPAKGETAKLMNAAMICQLLNGGRVGFPLTSRKVSVAMKRLGFESVHCMNGNFFQVIEIPYDQVQAHLSAEAYDFAHKDKPDAHEPELPAEPKLPF